MPTRGEYLAKIMSLLESSVEGFDIYSFCAENIPPNVNSSEYLAEEADRAWTVQVTNAALAVINRKDRT